jgi:hypothetical protein
MKYCETCRFAVPTKRYSGEVELRCTSNLICEDYGCAVPDNGMVYDYSEGGGFTVGPHFGCVNHEEAACQMK